MRNATSLGGLLILILVACSGAIAPVAGDTDASTSSPPPSPNPPPEPPPPVPPPVPTIDASLPVPDAGTPDVTTGATLYLRLGGHAGIEAYVTAVIAQELKDPQQAAFFTQVGQPGHPSYADIIDCMTDAVGLATGGLEPYPTVLPDGYPCRALKTAHAGLHITDPIYTAFVTLATSVASAQGVSPQDVASLGALYNGTRPLIVSP